MSTTEPVPVDDVTPVPPFATGRFPVTPEAKGKPVMFVATPDVGVPKAGVTRVGDVFKTLLPLPVDDVDPVPPFAIGRFPVTPEARGKPVMFVATPDAGVPNAGVTKVGLVFKTLLPLPVDDVTPVPPFATAVKIDDKRVTVPPVFLKYNFPSVMLIASSPATKFPAAGTADAVVVLYREIGVKPDAAMLDP